MQEIIGQFGGEAMRRITLCGRHYDFGDYISPNTLNRVPLRNRRALCKIGDILLYSEPQTNKQDKNDLKKAHEDLEASGEETESSRLEPSQVKPLETLSLERKRKQGRPRIHPLGT